MHKNIHTQETARQLPRPLIQDGRPNFNPTPQDYHAAGWRDVVDMPTPKGYVRTGWQEPVWNEAADRFERRPVTITQAEHDAQQQAAIDAADPDWFPAGIETSRLVLQSETERKGIAYIAADDGELLSFVEHASPRLSPEERLAAIADKLAQHADKKQAQAAAVRELNKGTLQQRIEAIEAWILAQ